MAGHRGFVFVTIGIFLSGCSMQATVPVASAPAVPTADVPAAGETIAVATLNADAADDPAIWARSDGAAFDFAGKRVDGVILGTDKKAGLYAFALDGKVLQFLPEGLLNNVDLRADKDGFLAGASDRGRMGVALYHYAGNGALVPAGFVKSDVAEPYGFCMGRYRGALVAVLIAKDGQVRQYTLRNAADGTMTGTEQRRFAIGSQSEGCAVDDDTGDLYVGEEMRGVWRYSLDPAHGERTLVQGVGDGRLVADVEGVTLIRDGAEKFLIVSSQGDSAFAVWRLGGAAPAYAGRFRVAAAGGVDGVSGTDGLDAFSGPIGNFPGGLVVTQDDVNEGGAQNFKLVDWRAIRTALRE
jgi:3-phytase